MPVAQFDVSTATTTSVITAPGAGKRIEVLGYSLSSVGNNVVTLRSADPTVFTVSSVAQTNAFIYDVQTGREWVGGDNQAIQIITAAAVRVVGHINYRVIG